MPGLDTCLRFDHGEARKAAAFYAATFPDSRVDRVNTSPAEYPGGRGGDELTVEFTVLGRKFIGLNGGSTFTPNESVSFVVVTDDQEETDPYWNAIVGNGGQETRTLDAATWAAELALGEGLQRIYVVEPTGPIEADPNVTDKRFRGNPTKSFRSRHPLRVMGELAKWKSHSEDAIAAMQAALEALKRQGVVPLDD